MKLTHCGITFDVKRKLTQKHTYIRIQPNGAVIVSTNCFTPKKTLLHFIEKKHAWITKQLQHRPSIPTHDYHDKAKLKEQAKSLILPLVEKWSTIMIVSPTHVGFRYNKSRWGSCSHQNRLSFNTRLSLMHPDFIEYVVVHELAHIRHKNHSQAFWDEVAHYLPDYKRRKKLINS